MTPRAAPDGPERSGRERVRDFLLSGISEAAQTKYRRAMDGFEAKCREEDVEFEELDEAQQDWVVAEYILEGYENDEPRHGYADLLSALAKVDPRRRLRVSYRVLDLWSRRDPPRQAPACPPEIVTRICMTLILIGREHLGLGFACAYAGILHVREMLGLRWRDVYFAPDSVVFCLGVTKRGREQRVRCAHPTLVAWMREWRRRHSHAAGALVFEASYSTALKRLRRAGSACGAPEGITTHSLRRSGASELSRLGVPWPDIMDFGRWSSDRAAREYVRRGEVAVYRARATAEGDALSMAEAWAKRAYWVWCMRALIAADEAQALSVLGPREIQKLNRLVQCWR